MAAPPALAVPIVIYTIDHGRCEIFDATPVYYLYRCEDGAILYFRRDGRPGGDGPVPFARSDDATLIDDLI